MMLSYLIIIPLKIKTIERMRINLNFIKIAKIIHFLQNVHKDTSKTLKNLMRSIVPKLKQVRFYLIVKMERSKKFKLNWQKNKSILEKTLVKFLNAMNIPWKNQKLPKSTKPLKKKINRKIRRIHRLI
jgi:hypothetical protein